VSDIKSMKLYHHVGRIHNELEALGKSADDDLDVDELSRFDQLHYHGTEALDHALEVLAPGADDAWLEIGSGLGGPARYLAAHGGIAVSALELQPDQHALAKRLTARCGLEDRVTHLCGDFLTENWGARKFDAIVSWLALYHIPERPRLLKKCHALLNSGGRFYSEDLCAVGEIDASQAAALARDLYAVTLPTIEDYGRDLQRAGFDIDFYTDMTEDWADFTRRRLAAFRNERERYLGMHGAEIVDALDDFYAAVDREFQSGKLGGVRICARRRA
jgi:cyclopropane fatty-acyl-phospholipid synthase-like methyltransferase